MHVQSDWFCSLNLLFCGVLIAVAVVVAKAPCYIVTPSRYGQGALDICCSYTTRQFRVPGRKMAKYMK